MLGIQQSGSMPPPSPAFAIIAAALIEHEKDAPGFIARVRSRLESDANVNAAIQLRGPRAEPEVRAAMESALAWTAILLVAGDADAPVKRKRWFWA